MQRRCGNLTKMKKVKGLVSFLLLFYKPLGAPEDSRGGVS